MYDLIVVGGGPVGAYLSMKFVEKGNQVLILEKEKQVGGKACSGIVSKRIFDFIPRENPRQVAEKKFLQKELSRARIWIEDSFYNIKGEAYLLNREKFDKFMLKEAEAKGVEVKRESEVKRVENKREVVIAEDQEGNKFKARLLAGADGANSKVARQAGLPSPKKLMLGVIACSDKSKLEGENVDQEFPDLFFSKNIPGFFAWRIPRPQTMEYGLSLEPKYRPRKKLEKWLLRKFGSLDNFRFSAALIPSYPRKKTVIRRVLLIGDAAGQIKPYTGGGLIYGMICADVATRVINSENPELEIYEKEWRKALMKQIRVADFIRMGYRTPTWLKRTALNFLQKRGKIDQDLPSSAF